MRRPASDTPLYEATERLLTAVERLDASIQHVSVQTARDVHQQQQMQVFERENNALRVEQEQLASSLSRLQEQYEELKRVATAIYGKLDNAIARITKIVDHNV
jgi:regulator of replication initiation timing